VYNSTGQMIKTISETLQGGRLVCEWDATDNAGRSVPAGVYFVRLRIDGKSTAHDAVERIVLVR
jgi:flagellar hook assembly protein FlgD